MDSPALSAQLISAINAGAEVIVVLSPTPDQLDRIYRPKWMPMPGRGKTCPVTGLPSSTLKDYILQSRHSPHPIRTKHMKQMGKSRGVRLVHLQSLEAWLETQPSWPEMAEENTEAEARDH